MSAGAATVPGGLERERTGTLSQVGHLARRSVVRTIRQPAVIVSSMVFPLFLLAINASGLETATNLPGFPTDSYLTFFLAVTFITGTQLASKKSSGIKEIEDLNGKSIALSLGTTNEKAVKAVIQEKGLNVKVTMVKDHPQGWLALETGRVDAYATDHVLLYGLISKSKNPSEFQVTGRFLSYDPYGFMVPRNDSAFRLIGNSVLADLMRSGEMNKIYDKWFNPGPTNINMPLSATLKTAFEIQALPY